MTVGGDVQLFVTSQIGAEGSKAGEPSEYTLRLLETLSGNLNKLCTSNMDYSAPIPPSWFTRVEKELAEQKAKIEELEQQLKQLTENQNNAR